MNLGGLQKNSLIDYPGKVSFVIFMTGCNFNCPYCEASAGESRPNELTTEEAKNMIDELNYDN